MSTEQSNATWSATSLARDESTLRNAALSVRQRKLLAFLNTPMSADALASMSGIPHPEVEANLQRFAKLGLAQTSEAASAPAALRASTFSGVAGAGGSKAMPMIIGGVALTALAAAIWWFMQSGKPAPAPSVPSPATSATAAPAPVQPALSAPGDSSTTSVFVGNQTAAAEFAKQAAAKEATTKDTARETQARDAAAKAASAKAAPTPSAPATAPSPAPAPAVAAAAPASPPPAPPPTPAPAVASAPAPAAPAPAPAPTPAPAPAPAVAAAPTPAPAAPAAAPREGALLSRVEPQFPRNIDADRGTVRARLTVNGQGAVTNVEIVQSNPPRVFDRNVRAALSQWRYEGTGETQSKLVEVSFAR